MVAVISIRMFFKINSLAVVFMLSILARDTWSSLASTGSFPIAPTTNTPNNHCTISNTKAAPNSRWPLPHRHKPTSSSSHNPSSCLSTATHPQDRILNLAMDFSFNCRTVKPNSNRKVATTTNDKASSSFRTSPRLPTLRWTKPRPSCASRTRTACRVPCVNCLEIIMARNPAVHHIDCQLFQIESQPFSTNFKTKSGRRAATSSPRAWSSADYYVHGKKIILQSSSERKTGIIRTQQRLFGRLTLSMS